MRAPLAIAAGLCLAACTSSAGPPDGGGSEAGDVVIFEGGGGEAREDSETDEGTVVEAVPGSITLVATRIAALLDRHCDHDGDGEGDNAAADLGEPAATLFAAALGEGFQTGVGAGSERVMARFPRLEDRLGPSHSGATPLLFYEGVELDDPQDPTDDFSGEEPFEVDVNTMGPCGEPSFAFPEAHLADGTFESGRGTLPLTLKDDIILALPDALVDGTVEPRGEGATIRTCFAATVPNLGSVAEYGDGRSLLEVLLYGGAAFGLPTVPGLEPDVDLDGDGLERLEIDGDGHIVRCVDGDATVIEGRDCWQDDRMADAVSLVLEMESVSGEFAGRKEGWMPDESCGALASPSLWSECREDDDCRPSTRCVEMEEERNEGIFLCR